MTRVFNKSCLVERRRRLRRNMPNAEVIMWSKLKQRQIGGRKFRRQYSVGPYVIDFYCAELKLAIELDGESHLRKGAKEYDKERQSRIEQYGIQFLRFTNADVYHNLYGVLQCVYEAIEEIERCVTIHKA